MRNYIGPTLSNRQRSIIIGTVLGGSSIVKVKKGVNCYLSMRDNNYNWIAFKVGELNDLGSTSSWNKDETTFRWRSCCYPVLNEFREMFYEKNQRTITLETLDLLTELAISIWVGDSGKIIDGEVVLQTALWKKGSNLIADYFNEINMFCNYKDNRITFTKKGSINLMQLACRYYPNWLIESLPSIG